MKVILKISEKNDITLSLLRGKKEIDNIKWQDENNLSRFLLANLDKLLKKNKVGLDKILEYKIISKVPRKWTTRRIVEITFQMLEIARLSKKAGKLAKKITVC